jgi:hypothetical protein
MGPLNKSSSASIRFAKGTGLAAGQPLILLMGSSGLSPWVFHANALTGKEGRD